MLAEVASGERNAADVAFLVAVIVALVGTFAALAPAARAGLALALLCLSVALTALGLMLL